MKDDSKSHSLPPASAKDALAKADAKASASASASAAASSSPSRLPVVMVVGCGCLVLALTLLLLEMFVLMAVGSGPALTSINEMNAMLRNLNQGASNIDFNFGITVNQPPPRSHSTTGLSQAVDKAGTGTMSASAAVPTVDTEAAGDAFFEWCSTSPCLEGQNCTVVLDNLAKGVDETTGAPVIPFPDAFCQSVSLMNENLCFCDASLVGANFPAEGKELLDNMGMVAMLCSDIGEENVGEHGKCAGL